MPNWKSYEASVRLLSAIIAAHPGLKLNYDETAKYYGGGMKYHAIWSRMRDINANANLLSAAFDAGHDPLDATLDLPSKGKKEIAKAYGGGTEYKAVWDRMTQLNKYAKAIEVAMAAGEDPIGVEISEVASSGSGRKDIAVRMGSDTTASALENRFRKIKAEAKRINACVDKGVDVLTLGLGDPEIAALYGEGQNKKSIENTIYRQGIRQMADRLKAERDAAGRGGGGEMAKLMGDAKKKAIQCQIDVSLKPIGRLQQAAVAAGVNPCNIDVGVTNKTLAAMKMAAYMGSDATKGGLAFQVNNRIKNIVALQKQYRKNGLDPKDIDLDAIPAKLELARCMGSDVTPGGVRFQLSTTFKPIANRQLEALKAGKDPKGIVLGSGSSKETAKFMGSDVTKGGLEWQFRPLKRNAKLLTSAVANGLDPKDVNFEGILPLAFTSLFLSILPCVQIDYQPINCTAEIAHYMGDGTTGYALQHRFREIKKQSVELKGIAQALNDGTTASALEHRFRPIKREAASMNAGGTQNRTFIMSSFGSICAIPESVKDPLLTSLLLAAAGSFDGGADGAGKKATPRKRAAPKKGKVSASQEGDSDEEGNDDGSPRKKTALNKTQGGRITKASAKKNVIKKSASDDENDGFDILDQGLSTLGSHGNFEAKYNANIEDDGGDDYFEVYEA